MTPKTDYPDDIITDFPLTLEQLCWLSHLFQGSDQQNDLILRAKIRLAEQQAEISARKLSQKE